MKSMTLQCKKEDAKSVSNPDHLRQTRLIHLNRKYFLRVSQRIRELGPTTVGVWQGKGGKEFAPSGRPRVRPEVLEGVKWNEERVGGRGGGGIYVTTRRGDINPAEMSNRRLASIGASIPEVDLDLSVGRTSFLRKVGKSVEA